MYATSTITGNHDSKTRKSWNFRAVAQEEMVRVLLPSKGRIQFLAVDTVHSVIALLATLGLPISLFPSSIKLPHTVHTQVMTPLNKCADKQQNHLVLSRRRW